MRSVICLLLSFILASCGDWPDVGGETGRARSTEWPTLLPLAGILDAQTGVQSGGAQSGAAEGEALAARAAGLRARAAVLRTPVADDQAFEALRARLAAS